MADAANINKGAPRLPRYDDLAAAAVRIGGLTTIGALEALRLTADNDGSALQCAGSAKPDDRTWCEEAASQRWAAEQSLRETILLSVPETPEDVVILLDVLFSEADGIADETGLAYGSTKRRKAKVSEERARRILVAVENLLATVPAMLGLAPDITGASLALDRAARRHATKEDAA
jgi:hypothetical protein